MGSTQSEPTKPKKKGSRLVKVMWALIFLALVVVAAAIGYEMKTSSLQSHEFSWHAKQFTYQLEPGKSAQIYFPTEGPFDQRLGYVAIPAMQARLEKQGYTVTQQVRFSDPLYRYAKAGFYVPYTEKVQAGLTLDDCRDQTVYHFRYPYHFYPDFESISPLVLQSLLFIENRKLLSQEEPLANPAIDWPRFTKAAASQLGKLVGIGGQTAGGSTLATQVEKYRHSSEGRTNSAKDKFVQMISASIRAYRLGPQTYEARKLVAWAYLNSVPLSAAPGYGEVHGLGDGLWVWFGADFAEVNRLLDPVKGATAPLAERGKALRQVVALMIAHRRPSYYLARGRNDLNYLIDSHLRLFAQERVIPYDLMEAALNATIEFRNFTTDPAIVRVDASKGLQVARSRLAKQLGSQLYDLDRFDIYARTGLNFALQDKVTAYLYRLADPQYAAEVGILGERLLSPEKTDDVRYSFTLFERSPEGFQVRVQTDNTGQAFDINESSKLELGSTAKLRVLTTYLEIIAELHQRYSVESQSALRKILPTLEDNLSRFVVGWLLQSSNPDLNLLLEAALNRNYSASPGERFFTGGGMHTFNNFQNKDNGRNPAIREALQDSLNLPFVRLLRDLVKYTLHQNKDRAALLNNENDPRRQEYLHRFADREGQSYQLRFWKRYQGQDSNQRFETLLTQVKPFASRLAVVFRYLKPQASYEEFVAFLKGRMSRALFAELTPKRLNDLYEGYGPNSYSLPDQGYIARVHPLELWLVRYLDQTPNATFTSMVNASSEVRQEVYGWLFKTRHRSARDVRIRTMLEIEAFMDIHQRWQRVGYPFDRLVPSLATALGSSGDRPAALAELMGIILNDGVRLPTLRIDKIHFAKDTPFETEILPKGARAEQVLRPEVARALRGAVRAVVADGTARRISGSFVDSAGQPLDMGGKTGTGDNRIETVGRGGVVLKSEARNRTATFVFYIGDNHFGTLTAYVPGSESDDFSFTSALPTQVLKGMAPILNPYLEPSIQTGCSGEPRLPDAEPVVEEAPASDAPQSVLLGEAPSAATPFEPQAIPELEQSAPVWSDPLTPPADRLNNNPIVEPANEDEADSAVTGDDPIW